jgi:hypothetical protein
MTLLSFPGKLRPAGTCPQVLLQPSEPLPFKLEIDLPQPGSSCPPDRIAHASERDRSRVFGQDLPPHQNQSLFQAHGHRYSFPGGLPNTPSIAGGHRVSRLCQRKLNALTAFNLAQLFGSGLL